MQRAGELGLTVIGRLNHVAIAVADLAAAARRYAEDFGAEVSDELALPEHGVRVVFVTLPNSKVELMTPIDGGSPIAKFVARGGGLHHVCYEVEALSEALPVLKDAGYEVLGDGEPRPGAHGTPVVFLHPRKTDGALIELEEVGGASR